MPHARRFLRFLGIIIAVVVIAGCTYRAAIRQLLPAEQETFRAYSKVMTSAQVRTYLAKQTMAERNAYLREIGVAQRFQALAPQDREAVLAGYPKEGMSAEALYFLWGEPYDTAGWSGHYEYWFYLGPSFALAQYGNRPYSYETMVQVYLLDGQVKWWVEFVPSDIEDSVDDGEGMRR